MKALILSVNDNSLTGLSENVAANALLRLFLSKGIEVFANLTIAPQKDSLFSAMNMAGEEVNTIVVLGEADAQKNMQIKLLLSEYLKDDLISNNFSEEYVKNYYKLKNLPLEVASLEEAKMPRNAKPIENKASYLQGFVTFSNGKHVIYLPSDSDSTQYLYENWLVPYIESKFSKLSLVKVIKTYGITKKEVLKLLDDLLKNKNQIKITVFEEGLELLISIKYSPLTPKEDIFAYLKNVLERLKNYIYSYNEKSIYEVAFEVLKEHSLRLSIAESITGGNIVSTLIKKNAGISQFLVEGITAYSNESKISRLKVSPEILDKYSAVSAEVAYEMGAGLLETSEDCNFIIATTGYASGEDKKTGLVYIAVGNYDGIHIYENRFTGSREKIIEQTTKTALFYFIKKLKQNNINLEQMFDNY